MISYYILFACLTERRWLERKGICHKTFVVYIMRDPVHLPSRHRPADNRKREVLFSERKRDVCQTWLDNAVLSGAVQVSETHPFLLACKPFIPYFRHQQFCRTFSFSDIRHTYGDIYLQSRPTPLWPQDRVPGGRVAGELRDIFYVRKVCLSGYGTSVFYNLFHLPFS